MSTVKHELQGPVQSRKFRGAVRRVQFKELPTGTHFNLTSDDAELYYWEKTGGGTAKIWAGPLEGKSYRFKLSETVRIPIEVYKDIHA